MIKKILIFLFLSVLVLTGVGFYYYQQFQASIQKPLTISDSNMTFQLKSGTTIRGLGQELKRLGMIEQPRYFEWLARKNNQTAAIQAGEYHLHQGLTMETLLDLLVSGETVQYKFAIIEGTRFTDVLKNLSTVEDLEQDFNPDTFIDDFKAWTGEAYPEGWLFPDTYHYSSEETARDLLLRSYEKMKSELASAWEKRQPELPLSSPYEALILASIVEKETAMPEERPLIAGVFVNRLRKGMKLQTDPTVIYGMGERYKGNIRKADLKKDTAYNTYTRTGLPPTPIALSGSEALQAVLHPATTDALFFVAKGGGYHSFNRTYKAHREAVIQYQLNGRANRYKGDD